MSDLLIDCLWFFFLVTMFISFPSQQLEDLPLKSREQKGEPVSPPAGLPVNSPGACYITEIAVAEQFSQLLGLQQSGTVKLASAAVLYKMAPIE